MINRKLFTEWIQENQTSSLSPIDSDRFPNREHEGLEGPFRYRNGRVLYYDRREGKYYDPLTDMFVDDDELSQMLATGQM